MRRIIPLLILLSCCLCGCLQDPCYTGMVACCPEDAWQGPAIPPCVFDQPTMEKPEARVLKLADMVDLALSNNPTTRRTWASARAAAFNWEATKSAYYPTLDFQESITFEVSKSANSSVNTDNIVNNGNGGTIVVDANGNPIGTVINTVTGAGANTISDYQQEVISKFTLSFLLLDFGGRDATVASAMHALFALNWTHNRSLQDVIIATLNAYYSYNNAIEQLKVNDENIRDAKVVLEATEAQFEAGVKTHVDVLQARTSLINFEYVREQLKGQAKIALGQLATALGLSPNTFFEVNLIPEEIPLEKVSASIDQMLELAKLQRPDLAATYALFLQKRSEIEIAYSDGMPKVRLDAEWERDVFIHTPSLNNRFYSGTVTLDVPLFHGFFFYNNERRAIEEARAAFAAMQEFESSVLLEVVTAYYSFKTAVEAYKYSQEFLDYTQETYNAILAGYSVGVNSILDLVVALNSLALARTRHVQARTDWVTSLANLSYATGSL